MASGVGIPLQLDKYTESRTRMLYARVCVEVNLKKELVEKFSLDMGEGKVAVIPVEYAWKPRICSKCSGVGHLEAKCKVKPLWRARPTSEDETTENGSKVIYKGQQDWETVGISGESC